MFLGVNHGSSALLRFAVYELSLKWSRQLPDMVPYNTRGASRVPETRDCRPAAVPFPKKEARPAEKGSRYVGLAFIFLGALLHNLAAEGALAKALLGGGGGDREGSRHVSEESKFVHYRDLEAGYRWRLRRRRVAGRVPSGHWGGGLYSGGLVSKHTTGVGEERSRRKV